MLIRMVRIRVVVMANHGRGVCTASALIFHPQSSQNIDMREQKVQSSFDDSLL